MDFSLDQILWIALGLLSLHGFMLLPLARKWLAQSTNAGKPTRAILLLVLETSQLVSLVAFVSAGVTWLLLQILLRQSGATTAQVANAIEIAKDAMR